MFLNKVKVGAIVAFILSVVKAFLPDLEIPEGLMDAIVLIAIFISQFFAKESAGTVARLKLKGMAGLKG